MRARWHDFPAEHEVMKMMLAAIAATGELHSLFMGDGRRARFYKTNTDSCREQFSRHQSEWVGTYDRDATFPEICADWVHCL